MTVLDQAITWANVDSDYYWHILRNSKYITTSSIHCTRPQWLICRSWCPHRWQQRMRSDKQEVSKISTRVTLLVLWYARGSFHLSTPDITCTCCRLIGCVLLQYTTRATFKCMNSTVNTCASAVKKNTNIYRMLYCNFWLVNDNLHGIWRCSIYIGIKQYSVIFSWSFTYFIMHVLHKHPDM